MLTSHVFGKGTSVEPDGAGGLIGEAFDFDFCRTVGRSERDPVVCPAGCTVYDMGGRQFAGQLFAVGAEIEHPYIDAAYDVVGFKCGSE